MMGLAHMKPILLLAAGVVTASAMNWSALASRSTVQVSPPRQDYYSGAYLYRVFCASCHGEHGEGDGPVADTLRRPPADLTRVSARAGGVFPRNQVIAIIDGRKPVPGHGSTEMPVWGDVLRVTQGSDDAIIAKRIAALVTHIESVQTK